MAQVFAVYLFARFGETRITVDLGMRCSCPWSFIIADGLSPILGADFLLNYNIIINLKSRQLVDGKTNQKTLVTLEAGQPVVIRALQNQSLYAQFLRTSFPQIMKTFLPTEIKHSATHHINTIGLPVFTKARRLDPKKLSDGKAEFNSMIAQEICRQSDSNWAGPLHMILKKNNKWCPCRD